MALSAGTVSLGVKPDTSKFGSELKSGILGKTAGVGESMGGMILGGLKTMAGPIMAVTAAFSIKHVLEESMHAFEDLAGSVKGIQRTTGGTIEDVSKMRGAMQLAGVDVGAASSAMTIFAKNMGKAGSSADGTAKMNAIFGQSIKDAHGAVKPMAELLPGLADKFAAMPNGAEKTALAMSLFGRSGSQMIPVLNKGSEGIAELTDKAEKMGLVLDDTSMNIFAEARESARNFNGAIQGLKVTLGEDLLPVVDAVQNIFRNALTPVIEHVTGFLREHRDDFIKFGETLSEMGKGAEGFTKGLSSISDAVTNFISGGGLTKMAEGFVQGREKMMTAIVEIAPKIIQQLTEAVLQALPGLVQALLSMIPGLLDTATQLFKALIDALDIIIPQLLTALVDALPQLIDSIMSMLPAIIDSAIQLFTGLIQGLTKIIPDLLIALLDALPKIIDSLLKMLPGLIDGAVKLFTGLVDAVIKVLPTLLSTLTDKVLPKVISTLVALIPVLLPAAIQLFLALVDAVGKALPKIIEAVVKMVPEIVKALIKCIPQLIDAGGQLLAGLLKGLWDNAPSLIASVASKLGDALINSVKAIFGIKSPSRVFHEIGGFITQGLANGISDGVGLVEDAMGVVTDATFMGVPGVTVGTNGVSGGDLAEAVSSASSGSRAYLSGGSQTVIYNAAPNDSISAEQKLVDAVQRARVLGWT